MKVTPEFPEHRRQDPTRQAELRVYNELVNSPRSGYAIYEVRPISAAPELDFAVWVEGMGCYGIQVKGGQNTKEGARWLLHTVDGTEEVPCPIQQTWDAALAIKTAVKRRLGRRTFVIPVLLFPDMLPDPEIERFVESDGRVSLLWGEEDLVNRLMALPETDKVYNPPNAGQIVAEVAAVRPALGFNAADAPGPRTNDTEHYRPHREPVSSSEPGRMDMTARQVIIQRADVVNVYTIDPTVEPEEEDGG